MLKNFRIEIIVLIILTLNLFFSYNLDVGFYNFFLNFKNILNQIYLKKFFISITILGDSFWYFFSSLIVLIYLFFIRKTNFFASNFKNIKKIKFYSIFIFFSVLFSGLITQIFKHLFGRPRPNVTNLEDGLGLKFLTFDSNFHSFPSGHSSTIFAVSLVLAAAMPKLKYYFFFLASIVALSRVVVGAHFATDIVAGVVVAFVGYKVSKKFIFNFIFKNNKLNDFIIKDNFKTIVVCFLILGTFLSVGPSFDIYFSGLFYYDEKQFLMQSYYIVTIFFRKIVIWLVIIYILILPIISLYAPIKELYFGHKFNIKEIFYLWSVSFFNLLLIINLILKSFWGRARPGEIIELGGKNIFSPWYKITDQCLTNCSFVSGDAAVGFSLVIFYFIIKKNIYLWWGIFLGSTIGVIRIMEGGHFISDVVFSGLIILILNYFIYLVFSKQIYEQQ